MLKRERALAESGGFVYEPSKAYESPHSVCGKNGRHALECLRTIPPREHGRNIYIRYLQKGVSIYLPCNVAGCGLALGDPHYIQGDGEVSGYAIEMDAEFTVVTEVLKGQKAPRIKYEPHYGRASSLLDIPSDRFYATTGFPVKEKGFVPEERKYLQSGRLAELENLDSDVALAARNALMGMIGYIMDTYGYTDYKHTLLLQ